ncbi:MAG: ABC transporter permease subunit [Ruminococcus sp.]|nr:ABC transporter permease subunit [Ruminococcus sp.]
MGAIFRREVLSYFTSPIGYIFLAAFYASSALFFSIYSLEQGSTKLDVVFGQLMLILVVLIPILTMRTISEEKKNKTDQCLLTSPVSLFGIVAGKFLAAFLIYVLGVAITLVYAVVVSVFASPDWTVILGNVVGLSLLGAAFISIGIFCSSFTENQMVSAVVSFVVLVVLYLFSTIAGLIPVEFIKKILTSLSFLERYSGFTYGLFDLSNVLFFISTVVVFLFLTVRVLERRRWA